MYYIASVIFPAKEAMVEASVSEEGESDSGSVEQITLETMLDERNKTEENV